MRSRSPRSVLTASCKVSPTRSARFHDHLSMNDWRGAASATTLAGVLQLRGHDGYLADSGIGRRFGGQSFTAEELRGDKPDEFELAIDLPGPFGRIPITWHRKRP